MALYRCPLRHQAILTPDAVAVWLENSCITFSELDSQVSAIQRQLITAGLQADSHLAVVSGNSLTMLWLLLACLRSGIVFCPLNPRFPAAQLEDLIESMDCDACYVEENESSQGLSLPRVARITLLDPPAITPNHSPTTLQEIGLDAEDLCDLILTSGSSGKAKAAGHCYRNHYYSALGSQVQIPLSSHDAWLLSLPLFHVGGYAIVIRCLLAGAAIVLAPEMAMTQILSRFPVTHLSLVNTLLYRLLRAEHVSLADTAINVILMGGGYVASDLVADVNTQGIRILTSYGLTESSSQACTGSPVFLDDLRLTSGQPLPHRQIRISQQGEIQIRGEVLFKGYYHCGGQFDLPLDEGWFATGDLGYFTDDGQLVVTGRRDNMFISGGENIQPEEIEKALLALPGVRQAVVVPVSDREFGQRPVAFVDSNILDDNLNCLRSGLALRLVRFKMPERIYPWPAETTSGGLKVNRRFFSALAESRYVHQQ
ncbi:o-succinylbenzoate--CoA ligase [Kistimonas asteriae]|uniref:o-succinylbenzoate--CoA ligase n=1 Tax=Kistimonas asteriae TaxID=517724 RepID=UPI001BA61A90|nr:o-succinylbenzoate--CoA ligase [Kistimonas asteriae]